MILQWHWRWGRYAIEGDNVFHDVVLESLGGSPAVAVETHGDIFKFEPQRMMPNGRKSNETKTPPKPGLSPHNFPICGITIN
jgi:hypothetical protein